MTYCFAGVVSDKWSRLHKYTVLSTVEKINIPQKEFSWKKSRTALTA